MSAWDDLEREEEQRRKNPRDYRRMPWGKHRGELLREIPNEYFLWLLEEDRDGIQEWLREEAIARNINIERIRATSFKSRHHTREQTRHNTSTPQSATIRNCQLQESIASLFRKLTRQYHPDTGGTDEQMQVVNEVRDQLIKLLKSQGLWE